MMRREEHYVGRRAMEMKVQGRRKRGRPRRRWLDKVRDDDCWRRKCTIVLHVGICHRTSTPRRSGNEMKKNEVC